jgi:hypothetical protein
MRKTRLAASFSACALVGTAAVAHSFAQPPAQSRKTDTPAVKQWEAMLPLVQRVLAKSGYRCESEGWSPGILNAADTGVLSFALIDACDSGASTDEVIVMWLDGSQPARARFRGAERRSVDPNLLDGSSVTHSNGVELVPAKNAIYSSFSTTDQTGKIDTCGVTAYVWNVSAKTFDEDAQFSSQATQTHCAQVKAQ